MIGEDIVVTVVEVRGNKVRLAFEAPPYVAIAREEILPILTDQAHRESNRLQWSA